MKLTLRLINNLRHIAAGESIPWSALPRSLADSLIEEGVLNIEYHGSHRSLRTHNAHAFLGALPRHNEALRDLDAAVSLLIDDGSRSAQAMISGNSKTRTERSCPGFLVNAFTRIDCLLGGKPFAIEPPEGSAIYIADWQTFIPPASTLIIGVENMENFLRIRDQKPLFSSAMDPEDTQALFVARYAFSKDLEHWLERLPNRYVHFGDFDLAGIDIFLSQFKPYVGDRGSFLIPCDIEQRLSQGSRDRYDIQYIKYSRLTTKDQSLSRLIALIHRYRRTYDQEGYIASVAKF